MMPYWKYNVKQVQKAGDYNIIIEIKQTFSTFFTY